MEKQGLIEHVSSVWLIIFIAAFKIVDTGICCLGFNTLQDKSRFPIRALGVRARKIANSLHKPSDFFEIITTHALNKI